MIFSDSYRTSARLRKSALALPLAVLIAGVSMTACGGSGRELGTSPVPVAAAHQADSENVRYPYTEADIRFMTEMIGHHAQAIQMARLAPGRAGSASVQTLARRIISSQEDEIVTMQQWLRERGQIVPEVSSDGLLVGGHDHSVHGDHHAGHGSSMPGMLTDAQLRQLEAASGAAFDRLFLTYMVQHHRGAVAMVQELFSSYGAGQDEMVFKFASDVNVDQITEIARMQRMLIDLIIEDGTP